MDRILSHVYLLTPKSLIGQPEKVRCSVRKIHWALHIFIPSQPAALPSLDLPTSNTFDP